jgi:hypothetical protein
VEHPIRRNRRVTALVTRDANLGLNVAADASFHPVMK